MADITVDGQTYRTTRLPTLTAMEIARRYSNALVFVSDVRRALVKERQALNEDPQRSEKLPMPTAREMGHALLLAAAQLPSPDQTFVVNTCLATVARVNAGTAVASRVLEPATGRLMFEDITPQGVSELVFAVLDENQLVDFFAEPAPTSSARPHVQT